MPIKLSVERSPTLLRRNVFHVYKQAVIKRGDKLLLFLRLDAHIGARTVIPITANASNFKI